MDFIMLKCTSCDESYSEERLPRNLNCGHSLCTNCALVLLAQQQPCPECHADNIAPVTTDIPINYPLLKVIRAQRSEEVDIGKIKLPPSSSVKESDSFPEQETWKCSAHGSPLLFLCISCSDWACQDCLVLKHPILPRGSCIILGIAEAMSKIKSQQKKIVEIHLSAIEGFRMAFNDLKKLHLVCIKYCASSESLHKQIIMQVKNHYKATKISHQAVLDKFPKYIHRLSKKIDSAASAEELTKRYNKLCNFRDRWIKIYIEQKKGILLLDEIFQHFRLDLKMMVEDGKPVYAVIIVEEEIIRWSPIVLKDHRLMLYCLRRGKPPDGGFTLPIEHVRKLIPKKHISVFFEVGTADESFGQVAVRLYGDSPIFIQMLLLCLFDEGYSYKNTCFFNYNAQWHILSGGDYENNDGTGGKPVLKRIQRSDDFLTTTQKLPGFFWCDKTSTRFHFLLHKPLHKYIRIAGRVTKGLDKLEAVSKLEPITKSLIRDCGLFIPMNVLSPVT